MKSNDNKILITLGAAATHLDVSIPTISKYLKLGMPCWLEGRIYHFHKKRIDEWFYDLCQCRYEGDIDPMEIEAENEALK